MDTVKLGKWILVTDNDGVSQKQLQVCTRIKPPLAGRMDCSVLGGDEPICNELKDFPAFCHRETNVCVFGLRLTQDSFVELEKLSGHAT